MKILFWSVGKAHEEYVKEGVEDFTRRIHRYFKTSWTLIAAPKNAASLDEADLRKKEAALVLAALRDEDFLVALDPKGKQLSSEELSVFIQSRANEGKRQVIFLIGGAYGLDETVLKRADHIWSLSRLTFPHQLVRLLLAEQVYRACTILRNEKYHHH